MLGTLFLIQHTFAGEGDVIAKAVLDGSLHQIHVDSTRTVEDSAFFDPANIGLIDTTYKVQNVVSLKINEFSQIYLRSAFSVTIQVRIIYSTGAGSVDSIDKNFTVAYDSAHTYNSRNSFVFSGAHKVTVKILSITSSTGSWDPTSALVIENQLVTKPNFKISCTGSVSSITVSPSVDSTVDELPVSWSTVTGADEYDLEWTYIDAHALAAHRYGTPVNPDLVFQNNATRATIAATSYNIPLIYDDSGTLFIRIRPIQVSNSGAVVAGAWSSDLTPSVTGQFDYVGHQRDLNWQSNIQFAEEGKRKVVVNYFDGSLRSRQTVTKDNTTNTTLVAETYYDYQGRPVLQVMPSPTLNNVIAYTGGFNTGINGTEYSQSNYDSLANPALYCSIHADSMSNSSGSSQYYSPHNPSRFTGLNQFIPDAKDYPFTETQYTPDNTGRISKQGGVGPDHQLGSGHETDYYYGTPDQNVLDGLFGTEVGDATHYFKNMVRDANGQYSVSYLDMHGRVIATALAGGSPTGISSLASNSSTTVTENLIGTSGYYFKDQSIISKKSILVPAAGDYHFNYNLSPSVFTDSNCNNQPVCYTCLYNLEITVTDNCNNQLLGRGGNAFDTVFHNYSFGSIAASCPASPTSLGVNFTLSLPEGNYEITKTLTPDHNAFVYYRDSIYMPNNTCISMQQFIGLQKLIVAASNPTCAPTCSACIDSLGTFAQFWTRYQKNSGIAATDTSLYKPDALAAYQQALDGCSALCQDSASAENDIRNAMLQDVTPPYGQYADTNSVRGTNKDKYSIFYAPATDENYIPVYQLPAVVYNDDIGNPDFVYNQQSNLTVKPNTLSMDQFVQQFRNSWAEALLPYHPEYCKLQALEAQHPSNLWDTKIGSIDTYEAAYSGGYLNPTGESTSPFNKYPFITGNIDPLSSESSALKTQLEAKVKTYVAAAGANPSLSMWALACLMVKCNSGDAACVTFYADPANDFDTTALCSGDLDAAWKNFRQLYLTSKQDIITQLVSNPVGCAPLNNRVMSSTPSDAVLFAAGHQSEFNDTKNSISNTGLSTLSNGGNGPTAAAAAASVVQDSVSSYYTQTCNSLAIRWAQQLSPCAYDAVSLNDSILPRLIALCRMACDSAHPMGASSLPAGVSYTPAGTSYVFHNFQDIINTYNQVHGITNVLTCNAELITAPMPYDLQPVYSQKPVYSRPSECECKLITDQYNVYQLSDQGDASFSAYLLRTQQIKMTDADLTQLRELCNYQTGTCTNLSKPIYLPASMQCSVGPVCATCFMINSNYQAYVTTYPADTPSIATAVDSLQAAKNTFFQNYMNNRLGYSLQAWEYLDFIASCNSHSDTITNNTRCTNQPEANIFLSSGTDRLTDIHVTADNGYIMVGSTSGIGAGSSDAYIVKADHLGSVQWAKTYGGTGADKFVRIRSTSDAGYIAIGTTSSGLYSQGEVFIAKLSSSGLTTWTKTIGFNTAFGEAGYDIIQTSDGGYAALGIYNQHGGTGNFLLSRLDASGNITWTKRFGTSTVDNGNCSPDGSDTLSYSGTPSYGLLEHSDTLMVTGTAYDVNLGARYFGTVYHIDKTTGDLLKYWHYQDTLNKTHSTWFGDVYSTPMGYLIAGTSSIRFTSDSSTVSVTRLSNVGSVISYKTFNLPSGSDQYSSANVFPTTDSGYLVAQIGNHSPHIYWQRVNAAGTLLWSSETILTGIGTVGRLVQNSDSSFSAIGTLGTHSLIVRFSPSAPSTCFDTLVSLGISSPPLDSIKWALNGNELLTPLHTDTTFTQTTVTISDSTVACAGGGSCYSIYKGPLLCGKSSPIFPALSIDSITNCSDSTFFSVSKGTELSNAYTDSLKNDFEQRYLNTCMQAYKYESFTVTHPQQEYHYTLYYYDQAGNLTKTVPPAGVAHQTDSTWLSQVRAARLAGTDQVPSHTLYTNYRYNTLNQIIAQRTPDGGGSRFWYDRLGRLVISQNAKQNPGNLYSYTLYDSISRITQVGELTSSTAIADSISRNESSLLSWQSSASSSAEQITQTTYDEPYSPLAAELSATNLRNRVSWTALFNTASDLSGNNAASATYFSYDVLGNVDTLVQDFKNGVMAANGNRFKKIIYQYDLVSGKVNQVSYQAGQPDAFHHSYIYDAENRITNVQTSKDSIVWDNDAFYSYYAHGPLARSIIGEQQVQGLNYAYTLHGWLKTINPPIYNGVGYTLQGDGTAGSIVAGNAYNLLLNYYQNDFSPVSGVAGPDSALNTSLGVDYKPLFNGNISSMGVNINTLTHPLLYNYQYDQLNRLVGMDAWNRTSTPWSAITKLTDFKEQISYDPNGNIQSYTRHGNNTFASQPLSMDSMFYHYNTNTNQLNYIHDAVSSSNYSTDIDDQSANNYSYDSTGNLISDNAEGITAVNWTVYGKISSITKSDGTTIDYTYDPLGSRISKALIKSGDTTTTWYVRDAQGNVLSMYTKGDDSTNGGDLSQTELDLYGSARLGIWKTKTDVQNLDTTIYTDLPLLGSGYDIIFTRGNKLFELNNHLENVLATVSDKKFGYSSNDSIVDYYTPDVVSAQDYYPFGSLEPGRSYTQSGSSNYRYGFNGQLKSDEVKGTSNSYTAEFWEYDPRSGRRWNLDPKPGISLSNYACFANSPTGITDALGDTTSIYDSKGKYINTLNDKNPFQVLVTNNKYDKIIGQLQGLDLSKIKNQEFLNRTYDGISKAGITYDIKSISAFFNNWSKAFPVKKAGGISLAGKEITLQNLKGKIIPLRPLYAEAVLYLSVTNNKISVPNTQPQSDNDLLLNSATDDLKIHFHPTIGSGMLTLSGSLGSFTTFTFHSQSGPSGNSVNHQEGDYDKVGSRLQGERDIIVDKNNIYLYNSDKTQTITIKR